MKEENIVDKPFMTTMQWLSLLSGIVIVVASGVFTLTMIYGEFLLHTKEIDLIKTIIEVNDGEQTRRLDNKTNRNADEITLLKKRLLQLEKSGSDKE